MKNDRVPFYGRRWEYGRYTCVVCSIEKSVFVEGTNICIKCLSGVRVPNYISDKQIVRYLKILKEKVNV